MDDKQKQNEKVVVTEILGKKIRLVDDGLHDYVRNSETQPTVPETTGDFSAYMLTGDEMRKAMIEGRDRTTERFALGPDAQTTTTQGDDENATLSYDKLLRTFQTLKEQQWMMEAELQHSSKPSTKTHVTPWTVVKTNTDLHNHRGKFEWEVRPVTDDPAVMYDRVTFHGPNGLRKANEYAAYKMTQEPLCWSWTWKHDVDATGPWHYVWQGKQTTVPWHVRINIDTAGERPMLDVFAGNVHCATFQSWPLDWTRPSPNVKSEQQMAVESVVKWMAG